LYISEKFYDAEIRAAGNEKHSEFYTVLKYFYDAFYIVGDF